MKLFSIFWAIARLVSWTREGYVPPCNLPNYGLDIIIGMGMMLSMRGVNRVTFLILLPSINPSMIYSNIPP